MIFGSLEGFAGETEEGTPLLSAAINSARLVTTYTWEGTACDPPVVPAPTDAQPSFGGSTSSPRSICAALAGILLTAIAINKSPVTISFVNCMAFYSFHHIQGLTKRSRMRSTSHSIATSLIPLELLQ